MIPLIETRYNYTYPPQPALCEHCFCRQFGSVTLSPWQQLHPNRSRLGNLYLSLVFSKRIFSHFFDL